MTKNFSNSFDKANANLEVIGEEKAPSKKAATAPAKEIVINKNETKTERTQIVLRKSTKKALKKIARIETDGSVNELICRICEEYIESHQ